METGNPFLDYPAIFWKLVSSPWSNLDVAWGVIPMYMSLFMGELYEPKPSPKTAVQGGANLLWAGLDWGRVSLVSVLGLVLDRWYAEPERMRWTHLWDCLKPLRQRPNSLIATTTLLTILLGITSIVVGVGKKSEKARSFSVTSDSVATSASCSTRFRPRSFPGADTAGTPCSPLSSLPYRSG